MDNDAYFGGLERREQNKLSLVATFSDGIQFCGARSDTTYLSQVSFLTFYTRETGTQKEKLVYESDKSIGKRGILRVYVLQPSSPMFLLLKKNNGGRETLKHIRQIQKISLGLHMTHVILLARPLENLPKGGRSEKAI